MITVTPEWKDAEGKGFVLKEGVFVYEGDLSVSRGLFRQKRSSRRGIFP